MDDDFGDFGGFEAAEIVESNIAQPLSETLPWVTFQASTRNPDLLSQLQSLAVVNESISAVVAEADSTSTFKTISEISFNSLLPEDRNEEKPKNLEELETELSSLDLNTSDNFLSAKETLTTDDEKQPSDVQLSSNSKEKPPTSNYYLPSLNCNQESDRIQKDLDRLLSQNKSLEDELRKTKFTLDEQRQRVVDLMAKHEHDLEQLRKAGHDALTLITKEFQEQYKVAMLEQKETCEKQLQEVLSKQAQNCYNLMQEQHARLLKAFDDMTENCDKRTKEVLEMQRIEQTDLLVKAFAEEKEKSREAMSVVFDEERNNSNHALELALKMEKIKTSQFLIDEKEKMKVTIAEELMKCEIALQKSLENERQISQDLIHETQAEEHVRFQKTVEKAIDFAKKDFENYLQEQRQRDHSTNRRYLSSLDLFLESARHQLQLLMTNHEGQIKLSDDSSAS